MGLTKVGGDLFKQPLVVGSGTTITAVGDATFAGVVTATKFVGDISEATGAAAGLGTALSQDQTDPLNKIYYTNQVLGVGKTITVDPPGSAVVAYTQYAEIAVYEGYDLIVEDGDDLVPDILGISTENATPLSGAGGRVRADNFTNKAGTGAPTFPNGVNVTGVVTATSFSGDGSALTGIDATSLKDSGDTIRVQANTSGAVVTGVVTATSFSGDVTAGSITVGDKIINSSGVGVGTTTTAGRNAGVGTAIGTLIYDVDEGLLVYSGNKWQTVKASFEATGGIISTPGNGYRYHVFNSSSTPGFQVSNGTKNITVLMVGGGGGANGDNGGGGGAGGVLYRTGVPVSIGDYPIVVGSGGAGTDGGNTGNDGVSTVGFGSTAGGGGGGGSYNGGSPLDGRNGLPSNGSGGGAGYYGTGGTGDGTGGDGNTVPTDGGNYGGGGGAGSSATNRNGGAGITYAIFDTSYYWGGGGGSCGTYADVGNTNGGIGGGGASVGGTGGGSTYPGSSGGVAASNSGDQRTNAAGATNTGGGGAGTGSALGAQTGNYGGNGGSGVVIVRYPYVS